MACESYNRMNKLTINVTYKNWMQNYIKLFKFNDWTMDLKMRIRSFQICNNYWNWWRESNSTAKLSADTNNWIKKFNAMVFWIAYWLYNVSTILFMIGRCLQILWQCIVLRKDKTEMFALVWCVLVFCFNIVTKNSSFSSCIF